MGPSFTDKLLFWLSAHVPRCYRKHEAAMSFIYKTLSVILCVSGHVCVSKALLPGNYKGCRAQESQWVKSIC